MKRLGLGGKSWDGDGEEGDMQYEDFPDDE